MYMIQHLNGSKLYNLVASRQISIPVITAVAAEFIN